MRRKLVFYIFLVLSFSLSIAQERTVGVLLNDDDAWEGYTLYSPQGNTTTYLINNCGQLVHTWESMYKPGNSVYLQDDGSIYRASLVDGATLGGPGVGGRIERISWDGDVLWSWQYSDELVNQHHDFHVLENGNLLVIAWGYKSKEEAIAEGRDPSTLEEDALWPDHVVEVSPGPNNDAEIVWKWDSWDHLIQDFDESKNNYGVVSDNPGKININFRHGNGADWQHFNSIHYIPERKHIILSSNFFNEIWIIDHGITEEEAKGEAGDLLFRWGNPQAYNKGDESDRKLFFQHTVEWLGEGLPDEGKVILFNNGRERAPQEYSSVAIIDLFDSNGDYYMENGVFLPDNFTWEYTAEEPTDFYSSFISGAQQLPNGNFLIDDGAHGTFFEIDDTEQIVWKYVNPIGTTGNVFSQGDELGGNIVFRATKYGYDHPAFFERELNPIGFVENNGVDLLGCSTVLGDGFIQDEIIVYPNPTDGKFTVITSANKIQILDMTGKLLNTFINVDNELNVDISSYNSGAYILKINNQYKRIVIK